MNAAIAGDREYRSAIDKTSDFTLSYSDEGSVAAARPALPLLDRVGIRGMQGFGPKASEP